MIMSNNNQEEKTEAGKAIETLSAQMKSDPGYAWSWHCNLAMLAVDAGAKHGAANKRAAQFMSNVAHQPFTQLLLHFEYTCL